MFRNNFVKYLQNEIYTILNLLDLLWTKPLLFNLGEESNESHEDKLVENFTSLQAVPWGINLEDAFEEVADLDFYTLVTRVDEMTHKVNQEGTSLRGLIDAG